jgi:hypothetical protein
MLELRNVPSDILQVRQTLWYTLGKSLPFLDTGLGHSVLAHSTNQ